MLTDKPRVEKPWVLKFLDVSNPDAPIAVPDVHLERAEVSRVAHALVMIARKLVVAEWGARVD